MILMILSGFTRLTEGKILHGMFDLCIAIVYAHLYKKK